MVTTISAGHSEATALLAGKKVTVTAAADGAAFVERLADGQKLDSTNIGAGEGVTFGPYFSPVTLRISCSSGSASYAEAEAIDGTGGVASVNEKTGPVVLNAADVGAVALIETPYDKTVSIGGVLTGMQTGSSVICNTDTDVSVSLYAYGTGHQNATIYLAGHHGNSFLEHREDGASDVLELNIDANTHFKATGLDVAASDAAAKMTVDGVEYSIGKAIKVQIGADTYYWPLFGPVAP